MKIKYYHICIGSYSEILGKIREHMKKGFIPLGGLTCCKLEAAFDVAEYAQAMVLYEAPND